jgi:hypothetical protein
MKQSQEAADFQLGAFSVQVITPLSFKEQGGVIDICSFLFHERLCGCGPPEIAVFIDRCSELNIYEAV